MEAGGQQAAAPITPATQPAKSNKKTIIIILAVFGALVFLKRLSGPLMAGKTLLVMHVRRGAY